MLSSIPKAIDNLNCKSFLFCHAFDLCVADASPHTSVKWYCLSGTPFSNPASFVNDYRFEQQFKGSIDMEPAGSDADAGGGQRKGPRQSAIQASVQQVASGAKASIGAS